MTTPQKLAFIDVEKGVRMFSKLQVPCVAVVENMSYFEVGSLRPLHLTPRLSGSSRSPGCLHFFGLKSTSGRLLSPPMSARVHRPRV